MIRTMTLAVGAIVALAACQPAKSPEQIQAEANAAALKEMMSALGGDVMLNGEAVNPEQLAAALAQAGAMASAMNPEMSAEDRAKLQAVTGAMASGQVHPAAAAWVAGANKTLAILKTVKDAPSAAAAKAQLAPIYAEMAGPAATLTAMTEDQRDVAMGSALPQFMSFGMNAASLMIPLSSDPALAELVSDMLVRTPKPYSAFAMRLLSGSISGSNLSMPFVMVICPAPRA
jgi:hypothetical protein